MALKKVQKMKFRKRRNRENLKNKSEEFADTVDSKLVQVRSGLEEKLEDYWQRFKNVTKEQAKEIVGYSIGPTINKNPCMDN